MKKTGVLYLHGFASADKLERLTKLQALSPECEFYSQSYNPHDAKETLHLIDNCLKNIAVQHENVIIIGSSMGGFWADYFGRKHNYKIVIMNPAVDMGIISLLVGTHRNFVTGVEFTVTNDHVTDLINVNKIRMQLPNVQRTVLINKPDELVPYEFAKNEFTPNSKVVVFESGGHLWTNWESVAEEINVLMLG